MTEADWLACDNPFTMLQFARTRFSARKRRLYACAACRHIWPLILDERSRRAVETAERYADGKADEHELQEAYQGAIAAMVHEPIPPECPSRSAWAEMTRNHHATFAAVSCGGTLSTHKEQFFPHDDLIFHCCGAMEAEVLRESWIEIETFEANAEALRGSPGARAARAAARQAKQGTVAPLRALRHDAGKRVLQYHEAVLRDLAGPALFRRLPDWPADVQANSETMLSVKARAEEIYQQRRLGELAILADAIEQLGWDNVEVLAHLRSAGPHVRGCWALDVLHGKG